MERTAQAARHNSGVVRAPGAPGRPPGASIRSAVRVRGPSGVGVRGFRVRDLHGGRVEVTGSAPPVDVHRGDVQRVDVTGANLIGSMSPARRQRVESAGRGQGATARSALPADFPSPANRAGSVATIPPELGQRMRIPSIHAHRLLNHTVGITAPALRARAVTNIVPRGTATAPAPPKSETAA